MMNDSFWLGVIVGAGIVHTIYQVIKNIKKYA